MSDLRERVPGPSLIDVLLRQWDVGTIHIDTETNGVVIGEDAAGWDRGVLGERRVAALLATLGPDWRCCTRFQLAVCRWGDEVP